MAAQLARPDFYDRKNEFSCEDSEGSAVPTDLIRFSKLRMQEHGHINTALDLGSERVKVLKAPHV